MKKLSIIIIWILLSAFACYAQLPFRLPKGAGTFRLGIVCGTESQWLDQCRIRQKGSSYFFKDTLWKNGEIKLTLCPLSDSEGFILEVSGMNLPDSLHLCWAFGACTHKETDLLDAPLNTITPTACHNNVFSTEGNAFTVYYGAVMQLKVIQGIMPPGSDIRLSDARQQHSPLSLFHSGKKTETPVISALCPWDGTEKRYFCLYKQNAKADYNYFMLPELFKKELKTSTK